MRELVSQGEIKIVRSKSKEKDERKIILFDMIRKDPTYNHFNQFIHSISSNIQSFKLKLTLFGTIEMLQSTRKEENLVVEIT